MLGNRVYVVYWTAEDDVMLVDGVYSSADRARDRVSALRLSESIDNAPAALGAWHVQSYELDIPTFMALVPTCLPPPTTPPRSR